MLEPKSFSPLERKSIAFFKRFRHFKRVSNAQDKYRAAIQFFEQQEPEGKQAAHSRILGSPEPIFRIRHYP